MLYESNSMNLSERTKKIIRDSRIQLSSLASISEIDHGSIYNFSNGKRGLGVDRIERLLDALGYDIEIVKRESEGE